MELLKTVQKIQHTNDVLDIIVIEGLHADFIYIYNELKSDRCLIDFMPSQVFKFIEETANREFMQVQGEYKHLGAHNMFNEAIFEFVPYEGQVVAYEMGEGGRRI